jgi:hypothetical protein
VSINLFTLDTAQSEWLLNNVVKGFAQKVFEIALAKERFPRKGAKMQRRLLKRGSALRLRGFA